MTMTLTSTGLSPATVHLDDERGPYDALVSPRTWNGAFVPAFTRCTAQAVADECHALHVAQRAAQDGDLSADLYFQSDTLVMTEYPHGRDGAPVATWLVPDALSRYHIGAEAWAWGGQLHRPGEPVDNRELLRVTRLARQAAVRAAVDAMCELARSLPPLGAGYAERIAARQTLLDLVTASGSEPDEAPWHAAYLYHALARHRRCDCVFASRETLAGARIGRAQ